MKNNHTVTKIFISLKRTCEFKYGLYWIYNAREISNTSFDKNSKFYLKAGPHIHLFLKKSQEHFARIGEQVMCGSVYSYILGICHYASNTSRNFQICRIYEYWQITYVKVCSRNYSHKNVGKYLVFAYSRRIDVHVVLP